MTKSFGPLNDGFGLKKRRPIASSTILHWKYTEKVDQKKNILEDKKNKNRTSLKRVIHFRWWNKKFQTLIKITIIISTSTYIINYGYINDFLSIIKLLFHLLIW